MRAKIPVSTIEVKVSFMLKMFTCLPCSNRFKFIQLGENICKVCKSQQPWVICQTTRQSVFLRKLKKSYNPLWSYVVEAYSVEAMLCSGSVIPISPSIRSVIPSHSLVILMCPHHPPGWLQADSLHIYSPHRRFEVNLKLFQSVVYMPPNSV